MGVIAAYKKVPLLVKLFIAMLLAIVFGIIFGEKMLVIAPIGTIFLNLLKMVAIPLIIMNLVSSISSLDDPKVFGRIGAKISFYYVGTTIVALLIGLLAAYVIKPGVGFALQGTYEGVVDQVPSLGTTLVNLIPSNIFAALANGKIDQTVVFSIFLGAAVLSMERGEKQALFSTFQRLAKMFNRMIGMIMGLAPFGVFALMSGTVGKYGPMIAGPVVKFIVAIYVAIVLMVCLYCALVFVLTGKSPWYFLKNTSSLIITALSTSSSLACVPVSLDCSDKLDIPRSISSFTIPLGTLSQNGNGIMLTLAFLFTAQAAGQEMPISVLIPMLIIALTLTTGAGGIPGGGIVSIAIIIDAFGLPVEIIGVFAGIFATIDMGITMLNALGDVAGTLFVSESEKKREKRLNSKVEVTTKG